MIAYLKVLVLRSSRNSVALQALVGAAGAPLAFAAAANLILFEYRSGTSEVAVAQFHTTVTVSSLFFCMLAAGFALVYLMTRTVHVEKLDNRIRLLRSSGLDAPHAVACFLIAGAAVSVTLTLLALVGTWALTVSTEIPRLPATLIFSTIAMMNLVGPIAVASRLMLPQPFAIATSSAAAFVLAALHTARLADQAFDPSFSSILHLGVVWVVECLLLLLIAVRDDRRLSRLWN